jgi:hypothetical protein
MQAAPGTKSPRLAVLGRDLFQGFDWGAFRPTWRKMNLRGGFGSVYFIGALQAASII